MIRKKKWKKRPSFSSMYRHRTRSAQTHFLTRYDHLEKTRCKNLRGFCCGGSSVVFSCCARLRLECPLTAAVLASSMKLTWWSNLTRSLPASSALESLVCCLSIGRRRARFARFPGVISSSELREAAWPEDKSTWVDDSPAAGVPESSFMLRTEPAKARVDAEPSSGAIEALTDFSERLVAAEAVSLHRLNRCVDVTSACTSNL